MNKIFKMRRLTNAIKIGIWAFKNPLTIQAKNFELLSGLMELILDVADEGKPRMAHISQVQLDGTNKDIVSIWAGYGYAAEPLGRIKELLEENAKLKQKIYDSKD